MNATIREATRLYEAACTSARTAHDKLEMSIMLDCSDAAMAEFRRKAESASNHAAAQKVILDAVLSIPADAWDRRLKVFNGIMLRQVVPRQILELADPHARAHAPALQMLWDEITKVGG